MVFKQEFIRSLRDIAPRHKGCVATIGSFDGVHRGHTAILARLREVALDHNLPSAVIVFEPQPHEYFSKERAPARLMRLREKVTALMALGVDRVHCLRFDRHLRNLSAEAFVQQVLVDKLGVRHLEIGDDFRFGCDRAGDFELLTRMGAEHKFTVRDTHTFSVGDCRVSSTRVRELLEADRLDDAAVLLGRQFSISGRVIYGLQLGRKIDIPTANIGLGRYRSPVNGVYAAEVHLASRPGSVYPAVANVGVKPTVAGAFKPVLEVHLFDFAHNLYGQCLRVVFRRKLRNEQKFASIDALKTQIHVDIDQAKRFFADAT